MAQFKLNPLTNKVKEINHSYGDTIDEIISSCADEIKAPVDKVRTHCAVYIDGVEIDSEIYSVIKAKKDQKIMIVIAAKGGDFGQVFKTIAIIGAVVVASVMTAGMSNAFAAAAIRIGVAVGASLLFNALIPPPSPKDGMTSFGRKSYSDSQTFTISNQSNQINKYGHIPKVYGTHRFFPTIAASPYTEFVAEDGGMVQYFYAIYDFGLGPAIVSDIKIGTTSISDYDDVTWRLVDLNKPAIAEGFWDASLADSFLFYTGDINQEDVSVNLNTGGDTATRNAVITGGLQQKISVDFACPSGLYGLDAGGNRSTRYIDVKIEFAEVGTEDWHSWSDPNWVLSPGDDWERPSDFAPTEMLLSDFTAWTAVSKSPSYLKSILDYHEECDNFLGYYETSAPPPGCPTCDPVIWPHYNCNTFTEDGFFIMENQPLAIIFNTLVPVGLNVTYRGYPLGKVRSHSAGRNGYFWHHFDPPTGRIHVTSDYWNACEEEYWYRDYVGNEADINNGSYFDVYFDNDPNVTVAANTQKVHYATFKFRPITANQVKVRITRLTDYGGGGYQNFDDLSWTTLRTRLDTQPINTDKRHVFLELKIKATDQLSGSVQNLSGIVSSVLNTYNGSSWEKAVSSNPAWVFADLLTSEINKRAISIDRLDTDSLHEWSQFCDEVPTTPPTAPVDNIMPRFECNFAFDFATTLSSIMNQVANASQASTNLYDGKYGVLIDKERTTPVQLFTPRNSWDFSSTKKFTELPHALRIFYVDPSSNWEVKEAIVYTDGYTQLNATEFEDIDSFACTNHEQAWRLGRYMLAQSTYRQETVTIMVDFEHLVCTRGDYVQLQQDPMLVGGKPARVTAIDGDEVTIDDEFLTEPAVSYGYVFRSIDGEIKVDTMTITGSDTADLDGDMPATGDLFVWGEVDYIVGDWIVKSIIPNDDLTASLILVEKADEIYAVESSGSIDSYSPNISRILDVNLTAPGPVTPVEDDSSWDCLGSSYVYYVDLSWDIPTLNVYETFEVYVDNGSGYSLVDVVTDLNYRYTVETIDVEHDFKVLALNSAGIKIPLGEAPILTMTPTGKTALPSSVGGLFINVTNESLQLDWDEVEECDIDHYLIRFSPEFDAAWSNSIPMLRVNKDTTSAVVQARKGTYLIKAVDWGGRESADAALAITSIPGLVNLNIIEETNDFPSLSGTKDQVETFGTGLVLKENLVGPPSEYYGSGYYYYDAILDLGEIYTVRLQSLIQAEGFSKDDLMSNWATLASIDPLATIGSSEWAVETEYRSSDAYNVMSEWATMASIDPISEGVQTVWSEWRRFTMGDFTGRLFQFRLKLISNVNTVTPRVFDAVIRSDMPDRIYDLRNQTCESGGTSFVYDPAFKATPIIQITQDSASQGDYFRITNSTKAGFDIEFFDKNDSSVERQFDLSAKGYGRLHDEVI